MIDKRLNYGRHIIDRYARDALPYETVVDIGADKGEDLAIYRKWNPQARLVAIDCSENNIEFLTKMGYSPHRIDIEKERLPFGDCTVDVINANQIIEHTKELFWLFHEITRVLRVGGKLMLGVPNLASLHNRLLLLAGRQPTVINNCTAHVRGFTKHDILRLLGIWGGYRAVCVTGSNFYPFPPIAAKPLARLLGSMAWALFFLFVKEREYSGEFLNHLNSKHLQTNFHCGREGGETIP